LSGQVVTITDKSAYGGQVRHTKRRIKTHLPAVGEGIIQLAKKQWLWGCSHDFDFDLKIRVPVPVCRCECRQSYRTRIRLHQGFFQHRCTDLHHKRAAY